MTEHKHRWKILGRLQGWGPDRYFHMRCRICKKDAMFHPEIFGR